MMLTRREFLYLLGGALAACRTGNREPDYTVVIHNNHTFDPASLTVPLGSIVVWHNRSANVHTVTADPAKAQLPERILLPPEALPFDSGDLFSGDRWVYTFDVPGDYIYFSRYYELEEMLGVISVST
jgi:plastocyanin